MTQNEPVTTVIGIDPSLSATGIARWRQGRLSTITIPTNDKASFEDRIRTITGHIWPLVTRRTFVVLEEPIAGQNGRTTMKLAGLHYIIRYGLYARNVDFGTMAATALKSWATGHGGASKEDMVRLATATFGPGADLAMGSWSPMFDKVDQNSHEADALWLMAAGLHHAYTVAAPQFAEFPPDPPVSTDQLAVLHNTANTWPDLEEWNA